MITVRHLLDDAALGGVTRFLDALDGQMDASVTQMRSVVAATQALPDAYSDDVVVVHFTMAWAKLPYLMALRARRGRRPIVLVEHSYTEQFERHYVDEPRRFEAMLRAAYRLVDRVVAVSYGQAAWMRGARLLSASKLFVIQPFTDCATLLQVQLPVDHGGPLTLAACGRYCDQKGFDILIEAMKRVSPEMASLKLAGFGADDEALTAQAVGLRHVTVGGKIGNFAEFFGGCDAIVVPSRHEAFGQVALEARMAGRPLIVSDVGGLPEQVEPSFGIVVQAGDVDALVQAVGRMAGAKARGELSDMGALARETARRHSAVSCERWLKLLKGLVTTRGAAKAASLILSPHMDS